MTQIAGGPTIDTLLGIAAVAERGGNYQEAIDYYNRVLEADPRCSAAWAGKGRAAGRLSTVAAPRVGEAVAAFGQAIATADDPGAAMFTATADLVKICHSLWLVAGAGYRQQPVAARGPVLQLALTLTTALGQAEIWTPDNRDLLSLVVMICTNALDAGAGEPIRSTLVARRDAASRTLGVVVSGYQAPALATVTDAERLEDEARSKVTSNAIGWIVAIIILALAPIIVTLVRP